MTAIQIPAQLAEEITAWAGARGIDTTQAVAELLIKGLGRPSIWDLYPEAESDADLVDLFYGDDRPGGEYADYEGTANEQGWGHGYGHVRGHWVYYRSGDQNTYEVCASEKAAADRFRTATIAAVADWTPADGRVWGDCGYGGDIIQQYGEAGLIPTGTYE